MLELATRFYLPLRGFTRAQDKQKETTCLGLQDWHLFWSAWEGKELTSHHSFSQISLYLLHSYQRKIYALPHIYFLRKSEVSVLPSYGENREL